MPSNAVNDLEFLLGIMPDTETLARVLDIPTNTLRTWKRRGIDMGIRAEVALATTRRQFESKWQKAVDSPRPL